VRFLMQCSVGLVFGGDHGSHRDRLLRSVAADTIPASHGEVASDLHLRDGATRYLRWLLVLS
jgi:hypothetical protein